MNSAQFLRLRGTCRTSPRRTGCLLRMLGDEIDPALDPFPQRVVTGKPNAANVDHSHHRATGEIERSYVRHRQDFIPAVAAYFDDEIILEHTAAHLAVDHERDAAEHLLFLDLDSWLFGQRCANAGG